MKSLKNAVGVFSHCNSLELDCSDWIVSANTQRGDFNKNATSVIPPKAWQ